MEHSVVELGKDAQVQLPDGPLQRDNDGRNGQRDNLNRVSK